MCFSPILLFFLPKHAAGPKWAALHAGGGGGGGELKSLREVMENTSSYSSVSPEIIPGLSDLSQPFRCGPRNPRRQLGHFGGAASGARLSAIPSHLWCSIILLLLS